MSDSIKKTNPIKQAFIDSLEIPHLRIIAPIVFILVCALIYPFNYNICGFNSHLIPLIYYSISIIFFTFMVFFLTAENKIDFLFKDTPNFLHRGFWKIVRFICYIVLACVLEFFIFPIFLAIAIIAYIYSKEFNLETFNKIKDFLLKWYHKEERKSNKKRYK